VQPLNLSADGMLEGRLRLPLQLSCAITVNGDELVARQGTGIVLCDAYTTVG
jgi:hypothetical protein